MSVDLLYCEGGNKEEKWSMKFPFGQIIDEASCRSEIKRIFTQYQNTQIPEENNIINKFIEILTDCQPGGFYFENHNYLTFFAGKDLLCAMEEDLDRLGLGDPANFKERILVEMRKIPDVWQYLLEWQRLRELIQTFSM